VKGTWQGSGTWQSSGGPDLSGLIPVAVVIGVVVAVAVVVLEYLWIILAVSGAVAAGLAVGAVLVRRRLDRRAEALEATREARHAALKAAGPPPLTAGTPPAIEQHLHYHLHVDGRDAAPVIRTMLPGTAGDAITERK
jgi:hypothetical protein